MTASMKFEETTHLIKEMMTVYETDDAAIIHEIIKKQADCQKIAEKRQQEGKRVVKGLSRPPSRRIGPHSVRRAANDRSSSGAGVEQARSRRDPHCPCGESRAPEGTHLTRSLVSDHAQETIATNILNLEKEHQYAHSVPCASTKTRL